MQSCPLTSVFLYLRVEGALTSMQNLPTQTEPVNVHSVRICLNHLAIIPTVLTLSLQKTDVAVFLARPLVGGA